MFLERRAGAIGAVVGGGVEIIANRNWTWTSLAIAAGSGFVAGASGSGAVALVGKAISLAGGTGAAAAITSEVVGSGLASSTGNLRSQLVQNVTGQQQGISPGELGLSFVTGGAAAYSRAGIAAAGAKDLIESNALANTAVEAAVAGTAGVGDLTAKYVQKLK